MSSSSLSSRDIEEELGNDLTAKSDIYHSKPRLAVSRDDVIGQRTTSLEIEEPPTVQLSNRRKRSSTAQSRPSKRLRLSRYCDEYRQLLNDEIQEISSQTRHPKDEDKNLQPSQIGASVWTAEEKHAFFEAIQSLGKDDIQGIALRTKTKSLLEVASYLQLLQRGVTEVQLNNPQRHLFGATDFPAAAEISQECIKALDSAAAVLELQQERDEIVTEKEKWGDKWLLTEDVAEWVDSNLAEGAVGLVAVKDKLPAATLLNLQVWLELSERVFMNPVPARKDDLCEVASESSELPAIRSTAFEDFAALTTSITKRLVQASLFYAMSRCRARASSNFHRGYAVKAKDVHVACDMLGMKRNSGQYWIGVPRRCGIKVYRKLVDRNLMADELPPMDYAEVEDQLSTKKAKKSIHARDSSVAATLTKPDAENSGHESETSDSEADVTLLHELSEREELDELHRKQDAYMEAIDQKANHAEEARLWSILGREPPLHKNLTKSIQNPSKPVQERKGVQDLLDWRGMCHYQAEWETSKALAVDDPSLSVDEFRDSVAESASENNTSLGEPSDSDAEHSPRIVSESDGTSVETESDMENGTSSSERSTDDSETNEIVSQDETNSSDENGDADSSDESMTSGKKGNMMHRKLKSESESSSTSHELYS